MIDHKEREKALAHHIRQGAELSDMMKMPGWAVVQTLVSGYRERRYAEFTRGDIRGRDFRADCNVMDWLEKGVEEVVANGERAGEELERLRARTKG